MGNDYDARLQERFTECKDALECAKNRTAQEMKKFDEIAPRMFSELMMKYKKECNEDFLLVVLGATVSEDSHERKMAKQTLKTLMAFCEIGFALVHLEAVELEMKGG